MNGVAVGEHDGGHTACTFDITPHLRRANLLVVQINNQPTTQSIPGWALKQHSSKNVWYDWWHYGGIVRDVWISVHESALIRRQQIRTKVEGTAANVTDRIFLEYFGKKTLTAILVVKALPPDGGPAASSEEQMSDPKVIELAKNMMREMIEQAYNHPSIFAWSACNESATDTPGGRAYFKTMYDFIKQLDPDRYVTFADDRIAFVDNPQENSSSLADFIMWDEYFGAWHGPTSQLPAVFERIKRNYPTKMVVVSEFGTPGVFARNTQDAEKLRSNIYTEQMELIGKQDWIAAALMWCYQDYRSHRNLWPGETAGYVDHGVVDENRQRRPSYTVWQDLSAPAHVSIAWQFDADRQPAGFRAAIERRRPDEIPSYALRGYRVELEIRDDDNTKLYSGESSLPDIGPPQPVEASWPTVKSKSLRLRLRLVRPTGFVAVDKIAEWWDPRSGGMTIEEMKRQGVSVPE